jgi:hypothetical protein
MEGGFRSSTVETVATSMGGKADSTSNGRTDGVDPKTGQGNHLLLPFDVQQQQRARARRQRQSAGRIVYDPTPPSPSPRTSPPAAVAVAGAGVETRTRVEQRQAAPRGRAGQSINAAAPPAAASAVASVPHRHRLAFWPRRAGAVPCRCCRRRPPRRLRRGGRPGELLTTTTLVVLYDRRSLPVASPSPTGLCLATPPNPHQKKKLPIFSGSE